MDIFLKIFEFPSLEYLLFEFWRTSTDYGLRFSRLLCGGPTSDIATTVARRVHFP